MNGGVEGGRGGSQGVVSKIAKAAAVLALVKYSCHASAKEQSVNQVLPPTQASLAPAGLS